MKITSTLPSCCPNLGKHGCYILDILLMLYSLFLKMIQILVFLLVSFDFEVHIFYYGMFDTVQVPTSLDAYWPELRFYSMPGRSQG